ncbi:unnamed protein product [Caenorhabditis sp. 36 PRJEB53466]|nr:unnamed protein product [Caenorhabditis sp. 36 PRJEB53466]
MMSVKVALQLALDSDVSSLSFRIADKMTFDTMTLQNSPIGNEDLMCEIEALSKQIPKVQFEHTPTHCENQIADNLAQTLLNY